MNLNETNGAAPKANDIPLQFLEHETRTIKSETFSTDIKLESLEAVESDENILVKQELLHEELDIKSEDDQGNQLCKLEKVFKCGLNRYSREKPFKCTICDSNFRHATTLQNHLRTHTGEKPFKCNICERSFIQKSSVKVHLRTHTGEKPFQCNVCNKTFAQKINVQRHMITHNGERPC